MAIWWPFGHSCDIDKQKIVCLQDEARTTQAITTKLGSYIPLVMLITWLYLGGILLEILSLLNCPWKFLRCFFNVKHSIAHISGMIGLIDVKRKGGASVGYWVNYVTLTFDLTHDLDFRFFKINFQNSCISGIVIWSMWTKESKSIWYWADCMVLPFDHTHEIDLLISRSKFKISLILGMGGGLIDIEWNGCESIIHDHDCDLRVTMVGWVDVPFSEWGDFRSWRVVDISSFNK